MNQFLSCRSEDGRTKTERSKSITSTNRSLKFWRNDMGTAWTYLINVSKKLQNLPILLRCGLEVDMQADYGQ
jgi:hypothetical protein